MSQEEAQRRIQEAAQSGSLELDLSRLRLSSLPSAVSQLTQLHALDLSSNQLRSLPARVGQLTQLRTLDLSGNGLTSLPAAVGRLTQLRTLNLSGNGLTSLPAEVGQLTQLRTLNLSLTRQLSLLPEIGQLTHLQILDLSRNRLTSLPAEIVQLTQLRTLDLSRNWLRSPPPEVCQLTQLRGLLLSYNDLSFLPPEIGQLTQLQTLYLAANRLTTLPAEVVQLTQLRVLTLHGNESLGIPQEILGPEHFGHPRPKPPSEILAYYFRARREAARPLLEAKILIVGQAGVGKTSLVNRLTINRFDPQESTTEGIDIARWQVPAKPGSGAEFVRVNLWDFGGQEILHATHQFFLTERSLYLLVLDARKGEDDAKLHYWLRIIQSFGGNSPVLVVTNQYEPPNLLELNETRLAKDYAPNLRGFHHTSCLTGDGIPQLREAITRELQALDHVYDTVPASYFAVKVKLEARTRDEDYLQHQDYQALCVEEGVKEVEEQDVLLRFLHDLGSVLHFPDTDPLFGLGETNILNPMWVTRGVYKILRNPELKQAGGVLALDHLPRILTEKDGYPKNRRLFIVGMMRKFELCYEFADGPRRLLVTGLLSRQEPEISSDPDALRFEYHYDVLPEGVIPRLIVRMQQHLTDPPQHWRSGVVLEIDDNEVLVRSDALANRTYVAVSGSKAGRRGALTAVRTQLREIHGSMPGLQEEERVPLPDEPEISVSYEHLRRMEARGKRDLWPEGAKREHSVSQLLDGIEKPEARREEDERRTTIKAENFYMGDHFEGRGQIGAMGPGARAEGNTFQQIYLEAAQDLDLPGLAEALGELRQKLPAEARESAHYEALAEVVKAEEAAREGKGEKVLRHLKAAGQWTFDTATKIGVRVAAEAIKSAMGLP